MSAPIVRIRNLSAKPSYKTGTINRVCLLVSFDAGDVAVQPDIESAIALLKSPDLQIRQVVAYLLGEAGDRRAIEPLIETLADPHVGVRGAAANALGKLGDRRAIPRLEALLMDDNRQLVIWAAFALTRLGEDYYHVLLNALRSDDVHIRRSGILALEQSGNPRAIPALLDLLDDEELRFEGDSTVGEAAERALKVLGYGER
jgi:HEAT repeat protein